VSLMGLGTDICIPAGNNFNKMNINILFYQLDTVLHTLKQENEVLKKEIDALKLDKEKENRLSTQTMENIWEEKIVKFENRLTDKVKEEMKDSKIKMLSQLKMIDELNENIDKTSETVKELQVKLNCEAGVIKDAISKHTLQLSKTEEVSKLTNDKEVPENIKHSNQEIKVESGYSIQRTKLENIIKAKADITVNTIETMIATALKKLENDFIEKIEEDREETKKAVQALFLDTQNNFEQVNRAQLLS